MKPQNSSNFKFVSNIVLDHVYGSSHCYTLRVTTIAHLLAGHKNITMTNLLLKVNVKCGGRNFKVLPHPSTFVGNKRCIFFGADVTHPDAGDADSPSLAAVVASNDWPDTGRFLALQSEQGHRVEILQNLQILAEELMRKWSERNNFTAPDVCDHFSPSPFPQFFDSSIS